MTWPVLANNAKFLNEQDPRHGGTLQWPGILGFPVRSASLRNLKAGEEAQVRLVGDFHCQVFNLNNPEEKAHYEWVRDRAINGWFAIMRQDYKPAEQGLYPCIYLEWVQFYCQWPDESS